MGTHVLRGKGPVVLAAIAAGALFAVPAAGQTSGPPTADLGVVSIHAGRTSAPHGTRVTFTEVITNNGPEAAELDTVPQITGGVLVAEQCDLGISADTPFCEYGDVAPGTRLTTKFVVRVTATQYIPAALTEPDSVATGTVIRPDTVRRFAQQGGFRAVTVLSIEHDFWRFYRLDP